jgi:hypothetical protein
MCPSRLRYVGGHRLPRAMAPTILGAEATLPHARCSHATDVEPTSNGAQMEIPGLGRLTDPDDLGWRWSDPRSVRALRGHECRLVLDGYDDDENTDEFHETIANFLSVDSSVLDEAAPAIFEYYQDCNADWEQGDPEYVGILRPSDIWSHIRFDEAPLITRRLHGDKAVYVSLECRCDWEPEHGLQIVFRKGLSVNKVGPYNDQLSNADAYGDDRLEHVVYKPMRQRPTSR